MRRQVVSGLIWSIAQKWSVRLFSLAGFILLSNLLQPDDFGLVALGMAFIGLLQIVTEGGFSVFLIQSKKVDARTTSTAFWMALLTSAVAAGGLAALSPLLGDLLNEPRLTPVLVALSVQLLLAGVSSVQTALLQREMRFRAVAVWQISAGVAGGGAAIALAFLGAGVWALVAQTLVSSAITAVGVWVVSPWRPSLVWDRAQAGEVLSFSWKFLSGNILYQVRDRAEQFIIAGIGGTTLLGYWTIATRILQILLDLSVSVLFSVALPAFSKLKNDPVRLRRGYRSMLTAAAAVVVPVMVIASQTSEALVPLLFGDQWQPSGEVAAVVTLAGIAAAMNYFDRSMYLANGRPGVDLALTAVIVPIHVLVIFLATPYGLMAIAIASVCRSYAVWPFRLYILKRVCALPWSSYIGAAQALAAGAVTAAVMVAVRETLLPDARWLEVTALAALGAVTFCSCALLFSREIRTLARDLSGAVRKRALRRA